MLSSYLTASGQLGSAECLHAYRGSETNVSGSGGFVLADFYRGGSGSHSHSYDSHPLDALFGLGHGSPRKGASYGQLPAGAVPTHPSSRRCSQVRTWARLCAARSWGMQPLRVCRSEGKGGKGAG